MDCLRSKRPFDKEKEELFREARKGLLKMRGKKKGDLID